jgi:hypothetical protein
MRESTRGHVLHRLPLAHLDLVGGEVQRAAAEALHRHLEGDACAQRGLLEDEGQCLTAKHRSGAVTLHAERKLDEARQLLGREVEDRREIAAQHCEAPGRDCASRPGTAQDERRFGEKSPV